MMPGVLGITELESVADGYLTLDAVIKAAPVSVLKAELLNPGKFIIFVTGEVAAVEYSMDAGLEAGAGKVLYHSLLKNLHGQIFPAIMLSGEGASGEKSGAEAGDALGIIETLTAASAIEAADGAAKAADIRVRSIISGNETGGRGITTISGEIGDIEYAMDSVLEILLEKSQLYRKAVIAGPPAEMKGFLSGN